MNVGFLDRLFWSRRRARRLQRKSRDVGVRVGSRSFRFEVMEERRMMTADPLVVGAVYIEQDIGSDIHGDSFEVTFEGGAPGTKLTKLIIDGDQVGDFENRPGFSSGDVFYDIT